MTSLSTMSVDFHILVDVPTFISDESLEYLGWRNRTNCWFRMLGSEMSQLSLFSYLQDVGEQVALIERTLRFVFTPDVDDHRRVATMLIGCLTKSIVFSLKEARCWSGRLAAGLVGKSAGFLRCVTSLAKNLQANNPSEPSRHSSRRREHERK